MQKYFNIIFLFCVSVFLGIGFLGSFFKSRNYDNRELAPLPSLSNSQKDFFGQCTDWCNDHFGARWFFLKQYLSIEKRLNKYKHVGFWGKDDWIFKSSHGDLEDFLGMDYSAEVVDEIVDALIVEKQAVEKTGAKYVLFIAPDKIRVYPNMLPDEILDVKTQKPVFSEILIAKLKKKDPNFPLINSFEFFKKHYDMPLYYKQDTHWNDYGSYIAFQNLMNFFEIPNFYKDVKFKEETTFGGNIANDLKSGSSYKIPVAEIGVSFTKDKHEFNTINGRFYQISTKNPSAPRKEKVVILGDSYTEWLFKYFAATFNHVESYVWLAKDLSPIEKYKPEIVVRELMETNFRYRLYF